ncbi:DNase I-like protein [Microthyrium microscopicum]|uniref:DNase I-like protein n=1 Tax=Microthyrium microscopicum TaxID=703497 RepID=A0A6A6UR29_9PEZI|nr:DNase I-like protein [Microthyrium microscopicum]
MDVQEEGNHDGSSIKPVSSLRNKWESLIQGHAATPDKPGPVIPARPSRKDGGATIGNQRDDSTGASETRGNVRASLDIPRPHGLYNSSAHQAQLESMVSPVREDSGPQTPRTKARPASMISMSPSRSPPRVYVDSPKSNLRLQTRPTNIFQSPPDIRTSQTTSGSPTSPTAPNRFKLPNRVGTPVVDSPSMPLFQPSPRVIPVTDPRKPSSRISPTRGTASANNSVPPPINRAGKPKAFSTPQPRKMNDSLAAPVNHDIDEDKVSPFSTPPSEPESPPALDLPPPIPEFSKPKQTPVAQARDNYFSRPPRRQAEEHPPPIKPPRPTQHVDEPATPLRGDRILPPPILPPRRDNVQEKQPPQPPQSRARSPHPPLPPQSRARSPKPPFPPPEPPVRRSMDQEPRSTQRNVTDVSRPSLDNDMITRHRNQDPRNLIPPRRTATTKDLSSLPPPPRPPRTDTLNNARRQSPPRLSGDTLIPGRRGSRPRALDSEDDEDEQSPERSTPSMDDFPDASQANRRPPRFLEKPHEIFTKYETKLFAVCGEYLCTSGYITRAWNLVTGELLLNLPHGEHVKATSLAFKHARDVEDEGKRIWVGTNNGELHEIDIPSKSIIASRLDAHSRSSIVKIHRQIQDMWSIDEEGKLMVWAPGEDGTPSLDLSPSLYRIPPKPNFILILENRLWIGIQKGIWVYEHDPSERTARQLTKSPLTQHGVGDVTSGTIVTGQADRVYFGHNDGRITIYNRKDFSFIGVVQVREYKISSLVGVGNYLWAGFYTGMIYVYDTSTQPWKVLKDWKAHEGTLFGVQVDKTSIWKLDRLQVASLGTDGAVRLWDGMMTDDWLENDMQLSDEQFCTFNEITASVLTWNAGASKPSSLRNDDRDNNFFREYLSGSEPSDIYIFGFQELVDLEDAGSTRRDVTSQVMKKMFKRDKKKDGASDSHSQERMRHQYLDWKNHIARMLDENMPSDTTYQLLHTSNLVGLFTCIFVKDSIRPRIDSLDAAQIRLGMGGHLGNKGALVVRFLLDDSSLCFLNCHLAAGQRHTRQRNENVAAIMESTPLPTASHASVRAASFVGGGDGSMVLDHEICILNGDLNYRIDSTPRDTIFAELRRGQLHKLLERDQLLVSRRRNPGFRLRAFEERPLTFAPTYKYDVGTDTYDSSEKKRAPAWCDRVLYRGLGRIKMDEYKRWEVRTSDHRPVSGRFRVRVKTVRPEERERVRLEGERRFEEVKMKVGMDIKLDYLVNVLGMNEKEAMRRLTA